MRNLVVAVIVAAFVLVLATAAGRRPVVAAQGITTNPVKFEAVGYDQLPAEVKAAVDARDDMPFTRVFKGAKDTQYVLICLGRRPTGGFGVRIESVEDVEGRVSVVFSETKPGKGEMVTQVITHPWLAIRVDSALPIVVRDASEIDKPIVLSKLKTFTGQGGWSFSYPGAWDRVGDGFVQESATGRTITFRTEKTSLLRLKYLIRAQIKRKLKAPDTQNVLAEPLTESRRGDLRLYRYAISSKQGDVHPALIQTAIFYDGSLMYEFSTAGPAEKELEMVISSFKPVKH